MAFKKAKTAKAETKEVKTDKNAKVKAAKTPAEKDKKKDASKAEKGYKVTVGVKDSEYIEIADKNVQSMFTTILGGAPGFARGLIYEFYGAEGTGKTSTAMWLAGLMQKQGETYGHADVENAMQKSYAERNLKVDTKKMIFHENPFPHGQAAFEFLNDIVHNHGVSVAILDSLAAMQSSKRMVEGKQNIGDHALMMSQAYPKLVHSLATKKTVLFTMNQIRTNIGVMFGDNTTTAGGNAPKFYSSVRIRVIKKQIQKGPKGEEVGFIVSYTPSKNRTGYKRGAFEVVVNRGFVPKLAETAALWAKNFSDIGLIDTDAKTIAGLPYEGRGNDKDLANAVRGKEHVVFEAVNEWFMNQETSSGEDFSKDDSNDDDTTEEAAQEVVVDAETDASL